MSLQYKFFTIVIYLISTSLISYCQIFANQDSSINRDKFTGFKKDSIDKLHKMFDLSASFLGKNYYHYSPESALRLGAGFNPLENTKVKQSPFEFKLDTFETNSTLSTQLEYILITSYNQLREELSYDIKLSAGYGVFGKIDAGVNFYKDVNFQTNSLYLLVKAETEYGRVEAKIKRLKPEVIDLLYTEKVRKKYFRNKYTLLPNLEISDPATIETFKNIYGSKIPIIARLGASVYMLIEITNLSNEEKKKIEASLAAKGNYNLFSAELKAIISTILDERYKEGKLQMKLLTRGGDGFKHLEKLLDFISSVSTPQNEKSPITPNFLGKLGAIIGEYLDKFSIKNSAPLGFLCPSYASLGLHNIEYTEKLEVFNELMEINNRVTKLSNWITRIDNILNSNSPLSLYVDENTRKQLQITRFECFKHIDVLRETYDNIIKTNSTQSLEEFRPSNFKESDLDITNIELQLVSTTHGAQEDKEYIIRV